MLIVMMAVVMTTTTTTTTVQWERMCAMTVVAVGHHRLERHKEKGMPDEE